MIANVSVSYSSCSLHGLSWQVLEDFLLKNMSQLESFPPWTFNDTHCQFVRVYQCLYFYLIFFHTWQEFGWGVQICFFRKILFSPFPCFYFFILQIEPILSGNLPPGFDSSTCRSVWVLNRYFIFPFLFFRVVYCNLWIVRWSLDLD